MRRRALLGTLLAAAGCRRQPAAELCPLTLSGGWQRAQVTQLRAEEAPEELRKLGVSAACRAVYQGPAEVAATVYEMTSASGAFEANQKWRAQAGSLAFHAGRKFVVAEGEAALNNFARAFEDSSSTAPRQP